VAVDGFGSASETGAGVMLGLGYDIRIGSSLSLTPFWNGFAVRTSNTDANVGQLGLSLTVHKFQQTAAAPRDARPPVGSTAQPTLEPGYHPVPSARVPDPTPSPGSSPPGTVPVPQSDAGRTRLPAGTNYVGDVRLKLYYPLGCASQHAIPAQFQVFFQTSSGADADGFKPSADC
jgi:hypothetical protein